MDSIITNTTLETIGEESGIIGNIDLIFIFLVVIVVLVCLGVCFLVGKQKKVSTEEQEAFDELASTHGRSAHDEPTFHSSDASTMVGVDRNILRGGPSTPDSPPPSYYAADRTNSIQSYISQASSQFEIPPSYDEAFKTRGSLASTSIPEEGNVEQEGGSGVEGRGHNRHAKQYLKSESVILENTEKRKKQRRTKSDVVKGKMNRPSLDAGKRRDEAVGRGRNDTDQSLLREGVVIEGEANTSVSAATRFQKKDHTNSRFTSV